MVDSLDIPQLKNLSAASLARNSKGLLSRKASDRVSNIPSDARVQPLFFLVQEDSAEHLFSPVFTKSLRKEGRSARTTIRTHRDINKDEKTTLLPGFSGCPVTPSSKTSKGLQVEDFEDFEDFEDGENFFSENLFKIPRPKRTPTSSFMLASKDKALCTTDEDQYDQQQLKMFLATFPRECRSVVNKLYRLRLSVFFVAWRKKTVAPQGKLSGRERRRMFDQVQRRFHRGILHTYLHGWLDIILEKTAKHTRKKRKEYVKNIAAAPVKTVVKTGSVFCLKLMVSFLGPEGIEEFRMWRDDRNRTLIHVASERGHTKMIEYLQQTFDINPTLSDAQGRTPFHLACSNKHRKTAEFLTQQGCNPVSPDYDGTVYSDFSTTAS
ncbi:hypothetical protein CYMTET_3505 [Cymbomonas tetramitiformis]|uniref:Uncharacterized protein n=1 Tax=Cymbomonas tetramitiformis TaxID=36881 RepID=A0AAE0H344_9CHLO|nr:hypothetical protein CYMTET_3505 [Cymbomonas tetramitiformis]